ncbi:hypothetical protein [Clostridium sp.]|uniref:hypothetical protein n=1 Tax=Clostridium sp. TaxID=1506 RepID=UPI002909E06B|nr:hypothetical protein [Clostridium sp.]MDU5105737.1 hypothetical protein [Clostridium sp.]
MQNNKSLLISIVTLTLCIMLSSIWSGYSIQKSTNIQKQDSVINSNVFTISQVAEYIRMTEEEVQGIIDTEEIELDTTGSFSGIMFPYFIVNEKQYFYKEKIDEWLKEVSNEHREYDTNKKQLFK